MIAIVQELKKSPSGSSGINKHNNVDSDSNLSTQEKMMKGKEQAKLRLEMVNQLTAYVSIYNNAVISYVKMFQEIAILLEAVIITTFNYYFN